MTLPTTINDETKQALETLREEHRFIDARKLSDEADISRTKAGMVLRKVETTGEPYRIVQWGSDKSAVYQIDE